MEINLLPKDIKTKKFRFSISSVVAIIVLIPSIYIGMDVWERSIDYNEKQNILKDLENKNIYYSEQLEANKGDSQLFKEYFAEFDLLRNQQIDWVIVFDGLAAKLPAEAKITSLNYNGADRIIIYAEFSSVYLGAQYLQWLEAIDWVDVVVSSESTFETDNYLLKIDLQLNTQSLLKGGDINE